MSASDGKARIVEEQDSRSGRHTVESAQRFWMRTIAGGSAKSLQNVGSLVALATVGALLAAVVGGIWYFAVGDLLDDKGSAATSAIAGAVVVWIFVTGAGARAILGKKKSAAPRRRHTH